MTDHMPLRCGRLEDHDEHPWSRPRDLMQPRRTWHCNGRVVTSVAERQWAQEADAAEDRDDDLREFWREAMTA